MNLKRLIIFSIMLTILTVTAVSAEDNLTDDLSLDVEKEYTVDDFNPYITDEKVNLNEKDTVIASVDCPDNITGQFIIAYKTTGSAKSSSYLITKEDYNKTVPFYLGGLNLKSAGKYDFTIAYAPPGTGVDNVLTLAQKSVIIFDPDRTITVDDFETEITAESILGSGNSIVRVICPDEVYGNISVIIGEEEYLKYVSIANTVITFNQTELGIGAYGTYNVRIRYISEEDGSIMELGSGSSFVTYPFEIYTMYYGGKHFDFYYYDGEDSIEVKVTPPQGYDGVLKVFYNNVEKTLGEDYMFNIPKEELYIGKLNVSASLTGDSLYPDRTITCNFTVNPYYSLMVNGEVMEGCIVSVDDEVYLVLNAPEGTSGEFSAYQAVMDHDYERIPVRLLNATSVNGQASVKIPLDQIGPDTIDVIGYYECDDYTYILKYNSFPITIKENSNSIKVEITPSEFIMGGNAKIQITGPKDDYKALIYIDNVLKTQVSMAEGMASRNIGSNLAVGNHTVYVKVDYEDLFYSRSFKINVLNESSSKNDSDADDTVQIIAKDYNAYYNRATYTVTVYRNSALADNVKVVFKLNGKQIGIVKTKNGKASLKIKNIPKTYRITVTALGKSVTKKLTVKQVLKLKKAKVRKSARKLVLKATLKEGKKPLKGKKVVFKFKGKKYKAKTNKKGVAKVIIKKKVLKKLKVGKRVKYSATYIKDTVKRKAKIKR